ncbi:hypothetical protein DERF_009766 [Dermatophagoides farinae]|uniref:Uncharacterized protein n=1 Tax=Dermatophagoides farinae TaxID=6954 RepID=A0A922L635_DERFA|nr:hypothetical protein DERF_009766 [Dermatophagoides farinae]
MNYQGNVFWTGGSSSSSEVEVASKETHSVVCSFDKAFFHCSSSAHFAADFASNRWCSPSIEHRKSSNSNFSN